MEEINFNDLPTFKSGIEKATTNRLREIETEAELLRSFANRKSDSDNTDIFETDIEKIKAFEGELLERCDIVKIIQMPMSVAIVIRTPYQKIDNRFIDLYTKITSGVKLTPPVMSGGGCGIDGGHRITLAYLLGLKEIPVLLIKSKGV